MAEQGKNGKLIHLLSDMLRDHTRIYLFLENMEEYLQLYDLSEEKIGIFYRWGGMSRGTLKDVDEINEFWLFKEIAAEISELAYRGRSLSLECSKQYGKHKSNKSEKMLIHLFSDALRSPVLGRELRLATNSNVIRDRVTSDRVVALERFANENNPTDLEEILKTETNNKTWDIWDKLSFPDPFPGCIREILSDDESAEVNKYTSPSILIRSCKLWNEKIFYENRRIDEKKLRLDVFGSTFPPDSFLYVEKVENGKQEQSVMRQRIPLESFKHGGTYRYSYLRAILKDSVAAEDLADLNTGSFHANVAVYLVRSKRIDPSGTTDNSPLKDEILTTAPSDRCQYVDPDPRPEIDWKFIAPYRSSTKNKKTKPQQKKG
ncbi:hypothetical protein KJ966_11140 [bacterium]|nr:hypothetical protein [bacterium]